MTVVILFVVNLEELRVRGTIDDAKGVLHGSDGEVLTSLAMG